MQYPCAYVGVKSSHVWYTHCEEHLTGNREFEPHRRLQV